MHQKEVQDEFFCKKGIVIAYAFLQLNPYEKNYSMHDLELAVVVLL